MSDETQTRDEAKGYEKVQHFIQEAAKAMAEEQARIQTEGASISVLTLSAEGSTKPFAPLVELNTWLDQRGYATIVLTDYGIGRDGEWSHMLTLRTPEGRIVHRSVAEAMELWTLLTEELVAQAA